MKNHERQWLLDNLAHLPRVTIYARAHALGMYRQICDLIGDPTPDQVPPLLRQPLTGHSQPCAGCNNRKDIP